MPLIVAHHLFIDDDDGDGDDDGDDDDYQFIWRYIMLIIGSRENNKTPISVSVENETQSSQCLRYHQ